MSGDCLPIMLMTPQVAPSKADVGGVVADVEDDLARQRFEVDPGAGGDFAGDDGDTGLDHGFAGDAGALVLRQDGVENGVGDLVGDLVRVAFGTDSEVNR
jgi:hypothetical protein